MTTPLDTSRPTNNFTQPPSTSPSPPPRPPSLAAAPPSNPPPGFDASTPSASTAASSLGPTFAAPTQQAQQPAASAAATTHPDAGAVPSPSTFSSFVNAAAGLQAQVNPSTTTPAASRSSPPSTPSAARPAGRPAFPNPPNGPPTAPMAPSSTPAIPAATLPAPAEPAVTSPLEGTSYQHSAKKLNEMVNAMRDAGAQFELDLPMVVVCGNQSAGKSSLLEALSGFKFPRSTRCPIEVRMRSSGEFSCRIKLLTQYDDTGRPWFVSEEAFGEPIRDRDLIELGISRAQKALLNPQQHYSTFLEYNFSGGEAEQNKLHFTNNMVVLDVSGGSCDLTLTDLPGIIRTTERGQDHRYITLIRALVQEYIKKGNAIIVAAVTCSDDIANQEVIKLAKEADPQGVRTLGVLTKVDRISDREEGKWKSVVEGSSFPLKLGWYVVRNPDQKELEEKISFEEARKKERDFFSDNQVWKDPKIQHRLGVDKLRSSLSSHLVRLIQDAVPKMEQEVEKHLQVVSMQLGALPAEPSNPRAEYSKLANTLQEVVRDMLMASREGSKHEYRAILSLFEQFAGEVHLTNPVFKLVKRTVSGAVSTLPPPHCDVIFVASDAYTSDLATARTPAEVRAMGVGEGSSRVTVSTKDVADLIEGERGRELPGCIPYSALVTLIHKFQKQWGDLADGCFSKVAAQVQAAVVKHIEHLFNSRPLALPLVSAHLEDVHQGLVKETKQRLAQLVSCEALQFTLNGQNMLAACKKFEAQLRQQWVQLHFSMPNESRLQAAVNELTMASNAFAGVTKEDLYRCSILIKDAAAIEMMAMAMAYLKVASKRFADDVPMSITTYLLDKLPEALAAKLLEELSQDVDKIDKLMQEDAKFTTQRRKFKDNIKCLRVVQQQLLQLRR